MPMKARKQPSRSPRGLYDPGLDKDSCGVGFVVDVKGRKSRRIVDMGLQVIRNIEHRGAVGADPETGDGAGLLIQMPDDFFRRVCEDIDIALPPAHRFAVGFMYLPQKSAIRKSVEALVEKVTMDEGQQFLGWRNVPVDPSVPGEGARLNLPVFRQCFIGAGDEIKSPDEFERKLYLIRRVIDRRIRQEYQLDRSQYYVASFSCRTIVYKGMLKAAQLEAFYEDLRAPDLKSALAMIHMRFSTNTFPTWDLAHPFRFIAHNGEINTVGQHELDGGAPDGHEITPVWKRPETHASHHHERTERFGYV